MSSKYKRICTSCGSNKTKKDGKRRWRQSYKCSFCWYIRIQKRRKKQKIDSSQLYYSYAIRKQTYKELGEDHGVSKKTIQRILDSYEHIHTEWIWRDVVLLVDTTYFGDIWVMAFKDAWEKKILMYQIVVNESKEAYIRWVEELKKKWRNIQAIVCDGKRWLLWWFGDTPTQMCHFHQVQIIRRYITKNPILQANIELKKIVWWLARTEKSCFQFELERRYKKT